MTPEEKIAAAREYLATICPGVIPISQCQQLIQVKVGGHEVTARAAIGGWQFTIWKRSSVGMSITQAQDCIANLARAVAVAERLRDILQ